jgi:hypothetical protein
MTAGSVAVAELAASEKVVSRWQHVAGSTTLLGGASGCRTDGSRASRQPPRVRFVQGTAWQ